MPSKTKTPPGKLDILHTPYTLNAVSQIPMYQQLADQIRTRIRGAHLKPGFRLPDIRTLAELASVSIRTVNSAFDILLRERTCIRRPKAGTFVAGESKPSKSQRKKVCMIYHKNSMKIVEGEAVRSQLHIGIQEKCQELGLSLIYFTGDPVEMIEFYKADKRLEILGIFLLDRASYEEGINLAKIYPDMRIVYFNDIQDNFEQTPRNFFGIFHDDFSGGYLVGNAVASIKPRCIGVVSQEQQSRTYEHRIAGFELALQENGYVGAKTLWKNQSKYKRLQTLDELQEMGRILTFELLQIHQEMDAVFAPNDFLAAGAVSAIGDFHAGHRIQVFGYDNIFPEISRQNNFSTVSIDFYRMGRRGIEVICSAIDIPKSVYLPPTLIPRYIPCIDSDPSMTNFSQ